jgi:hypothetical protein
MTSEKKAMLRRMISGLSPEERHLLQQLLEEQGQTSDPLPEPSEPKPLIKGPGTIANGTPPHKPGLFLEPTSPANAKRQMLREISGCSIWLLVVLLTLVLGSAGLKWLYDTLIQP